MRPLECRSAATVPYVLHYRRDKTAANIVSSQQQFSNLTSTGHGEDRLSAISNTLCPAGANNTVLRSPPKKKVCSNIFKPEAEGFRLKTNEESLKLKMAKYNLTFNDAPMNETSVERNIRLRNQHDLLKKKETEDKEKNPEESSKLKMAKTEEALKLKMAKTEESLKLNGQVQSYI